MSHFISRFFALPTGRRESAEGDDLSISPSVGQSLLPYFPTYEDKSSET